MVRTAPEPGQERRALRLWDACCMVGRWPSVELPFHDVPGLIAQMDRLGIERALVSHALARFYDPKQGNERLHEELAGADRLWPVHTLLPTTTVEQGPLDRLIAGLLANGVRAVTLLPKQHRFRFAGPDCIEALAALSEAGLPVLINLDEADVDEIETVLEGLPELSLVLCRVGYRRLRELSELLSHHDNVWIDTSTLITHQGLEWLIDRFGPGRLLFATGAPEFDGGAAVSRIAYTLAGEEDLESLGFRNLAHVLGEAIDD